MRWTCAAAAGGVIAFVFDLLALAIAFNGFGPGVFFLCVSFGCEGVMGPDLVVVVVVSSYRGTVLIMCSNHVHPHNHAILSTLWYLLSSPSSVQL